MDRLTVNSVITLAALGAGCFVPPRAAPVPAVGVQIIAAGTIRGEVPAEGRLTWRRQAGRGVAHPLIIADQVLVVATTTRSIVTMNATTGNRYWERRLGGAIAGPPAFDRGRIYVTTRARDGSIVALDPLRGRRLWSRRVGDPRTGPVMAGRLILVGTAGELVAVDDSAGVVRWRARLSGPVVTEPLLLGDDAFVATQTDTLYRVSLKDGSVTARVGLAATPSASAALAGDLLLLPLHSREIAAYTLPALEPRWRVTLDDVSLTRPIVDGAVAVVATRAASLWRIDGHGAPTRLAALGGTMSAALTGGAGRYVLGRLDGSLVCYDRTGRELWRHELGTSILAPGTTRDGVLFVPLFNGDVARID